MKRASKAQESIVIGPRGEAGVVEVSTNAHEYCQHELELLWLLARGEKEIQAGKGHDLDTVLAEANTLLKEVQR